MRNNYLDNLQITQLPDDQFVVYEYLTNQCSEKFERLKERLKQRLAKIKQEAIMLFPQVNLQNLHLTFEDCFDDTNDDGSIYARCSNLGNQEIDLNIYRIANLYFKDYSNPEIIQFYNSHKVLEHEVAHIIDYQLNGDKPLSKQHDEEFNKILKILNKIHFYEEKMTLPKFKLLCENIEKQLQQASITYKPLTAIVHETIASYLKMQFNEFEKYIGKDISCYFATKENYIKIFWRWIFK